MNLDQISQRILELKTTRKEAAWEIAGLVTAAKAFFQNDPDWIAYAGEHWKIKRRSCYYYKKAIELREKASVRGVALTALLQDLPFSHVLELAILEPDQIERLATLHDLDGLSREEVRGLVADTLGRARPATPSTGGLKLPPPEQLLLAFDNDATYSKLSLDQAFTCGDWFARKAIEKAKLKPEKNAAFIKQAFLNLNDLANQMFELLPESERLQLIEQAAGK